MATNTSLADEWDYARSSTCFPSNTTSCTNCRILCKLKQLTTLRVSNNGAFRSPREHFGAQEAHYPARALQHLKRVPGGIVHMPRLQILTVHMNSLRDLPASSLPVSYDLKLTATTSPRSVRARLRTAFSRATGLGEESPRITSECFNKLVNLTYLRLDGNPLSEKLRKVVQQGSFQSSDETSFGFVLRKLVDGLSMADMQARIDVAKNVSIEDALDVQRKRLRALREIVPLRPDQCKKSWRGPWKD